jgi:hypothetical protein
VEQRVRARPGQRRQQRQTRRLADSTSSERAPGLSSISGVVVSSAHLHSQLTRLGICAGPGAQSSQSKMEGLRPTIWRLRARIPMAIIISPSTQQHVQLVPSRKIPQAAPGRRQRVGRITARRKDSRLHVVHVLVLVSPWCGVSATVSLPLPLLNIARRPPSLSAPLANTRLGLW